MSSTIKRPTSRASKEQMLAAFDALNAEYKKVAAGGGAAASAPAASAPSSSESTPDVPMGDASIEGTIAGLQALRGGFGSAVSALSAKLTAEASRLTALRQDVDAQVKQLAELHNLKVADDTLQTQIREYDSKSEAFKRELTDKRESFELGLETKSKSWAAEKDEHARSVAERDETLKKSQKRGVEEYNYELAQKRKADADAYEQTRKGQERELEDSLAAKRKLWAEREKQIADQEALLADFKAKHDELPVRLEAAIKRAKGEGSGIAAAQAKVKADLLAKDIDGERRVYELKVKSLEATTKERAQQIETLSHQLSAALKQAQDLAVKAIEGASNASSFMAVKEIALEQAKNAPKSK